MSKPIVSIIITTHNRASYLERAIRSVLNQDYRPLEIIVVDDFSTDNTKDVIEKFPDTVIYIRNNENKGGAISRNIGLQRVTGDYFCFLDDDDYYVHREKTSRQVNVLESNKRIGFVSCGYYDTDIKINRMTHLSGDIQKKLLVTFSDIETSTTMIRREIAKKIGFMDSKFRSEQNHDYFYRISKETLFDYIPLIGVYKDSSPSQVSKGMKNKLQGYILFHKKHYEDIKKLELGEYIYVWIKLIINISLITLLYPLHKPYLIKKMYEKMKLSNR